MRSPFSPGKLDGPGKIYWPEHPLANNSDSFLNLDKLGLWQELGYGEKYVDGIRVIGGQGNAGYIKAKWYGRPRGISKRRTGYTQYIWPDHPLAFSKGNIVHEHHLVYWQAHHYSEKVRRLLSNGHLIHHKNGKRSDNRIENLEILRKADHPIGVRESDMVDTLSNLGYRIQAPLIGVE